MNPKKHLEYYSRIYPSAWKQVDNFRAARGKDLPFWPDWCFMPLAGVYAIVSAEAEKQGIDITSPENMFLINDVGIIGALAAWRVTQGVYRFDQEVYRSVIDTPVTGDLPHDVLFGLPEWCVYVETPGLEFLGQPLAGFFAYLEYDVHDGRKELRLVLDHTRPEDERPRLMSQVIHLGPWSLLEAVERAMQEAERVSRDMFVSTTPFPPGVAEYIQNNYMPLVSLLLYICSANGEIGDGQRRPARPRPKKTKKGQRLFPPLKVSVWDVGVRMGAALRREKDAAYREYRETETGDEKRRASPRPHVRRAHWHGYWTGPRGGDRKFVLKWMPPILVGGDDNDDKPVTIRPVK
jgi:hypothetical protein